jgi:hypothetical protein
MSSLDYPHCIKVTPGKPDSFPYTEFERRSIEVELRRITAGDDYRYFVVTWCGRELPAADTPETAYDVARFYLTLGSLNERKSHLPEA